MRGWSQTEGLGPQLARRDPAGRACGAATLSLVAALSVAVLLLAAGVGLRATGTSHGAGGPRTPLHKSFDDFPHDFLGYTWRRDKLDEATEVVAGADAYLKLLGTRPGGATWIDLYATYLGAGRTLLEHEPQVCYGAQDWKLPFGIVKSEIPMPARDGRPAWQLPVNIYLFSRDFEYVMVVNYYCVNWHYSSSRTDVRLMDDKPGGFYLQTRVTLPLSEADLAECTPDNVAALLEKNPRYRQAVEVLRFAAPLLEDYLPPRSPADQGSSRSGS
jgi:hypothetical protein